MARVASAPSPNGASRPSSQALTPTPAAAVPVDVPVRTPVILPRGLSIRDAAAYVGVSTWTVRSWLEAGTLKRLRIPMTSSETRKSGELRKILIDRVDLDNLIERWKSP